MSKSKIEWTDLTINPIVGCTKVSPGCEHCYAEKMALRLKAMGLAQYKYVVDENGWNGNTAFVPSAFDSIPKRGNKKIFIGSMTDIFHESVMTTWLNRIFFEVSKYPQHTFIILTKRPGRMKEYFNSSQYFKMLSIKNLWLGVTVCNQKEADRNIPLLLQTPAAKRFVSVEPMLGEVDLKLNHWVCSECGDWTGDVYLTDDNHCKCDLYVEERWKNELDWVIVGGESGPGARPLNPDWVISLRDQCQAADVAFFFKQWGPKKAGSLLEGIKYKEFPK